MNVVGSTRVLGVFGHPVSHSLSPVLHNAAIEHLNIDYVYVPFHVLPKELEHAVEGVRALRIAGVNVTIPHKERVLGLLDEVSDPARQTGSANTIVNRDGCLFGDSTDGPGFVRSAEAEWGSIAGARVLILGAGGSARAISFALASIGCSLVVANRTVERGVELMAALKSVFPERAVKAVGLETEQIASELRDVDLLVNTTSVGMSPDAGGIPIPPDLLRPGLMVYDLVYNPLKTRLIAEAESRGAKAVSGLGMLVYQGALSFELWTGIEAPIDVMKQAAMSHFVSR